MREATRSPTYAPLLNRTGNSHDDGDGDSFEQDSNEKAVDGAEISKDRRLTLVTISAAILALTCTLVNVSFLFHWNSPSTFSFISGIKELEYADTYVGLDTAIYETPLIPPKPISNFPLVIAQVNRSDPRTVYLDNHRYMSALGMIYPEDKKVLITNEVSTVMQFRILDFGMESCKLNVTIPSGDEAKADKKNATISSDPLVLDIWYLQASKGVDTSRLSWSTLPKRQGLFTSLRIEAGRTTQSPEFHCRSGSLYTFELTCSDPRCHLEFQQDMKVPRLAFFLSQESSLSMSGEIL
ncbi:hypothetical protein BDQ12DRAFT_635563 [Crucibulum laeve]|uniref:Ubiquitin 3 binding protein But2 C-terminal domain-containing protein n=1 Tax=Crucibulum laeve TaxID=68775 RepID=A0A5C3LQQ9_9AGAR|nr:hypothetical protein BDQ12DRAFT_635563 [Crucibulum laeve]